MRKNESVTDLLIKKVRFEGDALEVHVNDDDSSAAVERKSVVKSPSDNVHPDLSSALQAIEPHVRKVLSLPKNWANNSLTVRGVSYSYSDKTGVDGAVVSCSTLLPGLNAPFFFNTPYLEIRRHTEEGDRAEMPEDALAAFDKLKLEALAFLNGKRNQGELFAEAAE